MLTPVKLEISNFLSFEEVTYEYQNGEVVSIFGVNLTDTGKESNGSGKSGFHQAVDYALTGECSRDVINKKIVRRGCKEAKISFTLFNTSSEEIIEIKRIIPTNDSSKLVILLNGESVKFAKVPDGNKWIENYIGISKSDLRSFYLPSESTFIPFFNFNNADKINVINRFSGALMVNGAEKLIDEDIKKLNLIDFQYETDIMKSLGKTDLHNESMLEYSEESLELKRLKEKEDRQNQVKDIKFEITELEDQRDEKLLSIIRSSERSEILSLRVERIKRIMSSMTSKEEDDLTKQKKEKVKSTKDDINNKNIEVKGIEPEISLLSTKISSITTKLLGKISCPKCKHEFIPGDINANTSNLEIEKKKLSKEKDTKNSKKLTLEKEVEELNESLRKLNLEISELQEESLNIENRKSKANSLLIKTSNEIETLISGIEKDNKSVLSLNSDIEKKEDEITELEKPIDTSKFLEGKTELENKLKEEEKFREEKNKLRTENAQELASLKECILIFKEFKAYLANQKLKLIEGLSNQRLKDMKVDMQIKFDGYKVLSDGTLKESITGYILENGELCEYNELSKGERTRANYAVILAFQTLLNSSAKVSGGLDFLFSDEISEGLDPLGVMMVLQSLSNSGRTCQMITHVPVPKWHNNLFIVKRNGISQLEYDKESIYRD